MKITMNSKKATNLIAKFNKVPSRRKVRTQTQNFFIDRLARGLVAPQLTSPQLVQ
jgi:hypothetical protein